jgi:hypothetical protein
MLPGNRKGPRRKGESPGFGKYSNPKGPSALTLPRTGVFPASSFPLSPVPYFVESRVEGLGLNHKPLGYESGNDRNFK